MHLFYAGKKQRIYTLLILDTNNFMESLRDSFEAAWCPKGCENPKEKGQGEKDRIFSNHLEPLHYCYLYYHSHMEPAIVLQKTHSFKDLSGPHSGDKE